MKRIALLLPLLLLLVGCGTTTTSSYPTPTASASSSTVHPKGCVARDSRPDPRCTPGAVFSGVTPQKLCVSGYTQSVRAVSQAEKDRVYAEYGIVHHTTGQYEIDHLISLELGGNNDISNLWPEAAAPVPGFHQKDVLENVMHDKVCSGALSLQAEQHEIATNWIQAYEEMNREPKP